MKKKITITEIDHGRNITDHLESQLYNDTSLLSEERNNEKVKSKTKTKTKTASGFISKSKEQIESITNLEQLEDKFEKVKTRIKKKQRK